VFSVSPSSSNHFDSNSKFSIGNCDKGFSGEFNNELSKLVSSDKGFSGESKFELSKLGLLGTSFLIKGILDISLLIIGIIGLFIITKEIKLLAIGNQSELNIHKTI
jgi:hypothetical protein